MSSASRPLRISIVGPAGSGKLTALRSLIGNVPVNQRGKLTPVESGSEILLTIQLGAGGGKGGQFEIATVHGEVASVVTWRKLLQDTEGIIFLADAVEERLHANANNLRRVRETLEYLDRDPDRIPCVFAWNRRDLSNEKQIERLDKELNFCYAPAFETVATTGYGLLKVLKSIRDQILAHREPAVETAVDKIEQAAVQPPAVEAVQEVVQKVREEMKETQADAAAEVLREKEPIEPEEVAPVEESLGIEGLPSIDPDDPNGAYESTLPGFATVHPREEEKRAAEEIPAEASNESETSAAATDVPSAESDHGSGEAFVNQQPESTQTKSTEPETDPTGNGKRWKLFGFNTRNSFGLSSSEERVEEPSKPVPEPPVEPQHRAPQHTYGMRSEEQEKIEPSSPTHDEPTSSPEPMRPEKPVRGPVFRFPEVKATTEDMEHPSASDEDEPQDRGGIWRRLARNIRNKRS